MLKDKKNWMSVKFLRHCIAEFNYGDQYRPQKSHALDITCDSDNYIMFYNITIFKVVYSIEQYSNSNMTIESKTKK